MASLGIHHETATNDEIAAYCSNPNHIPLGGAPYGNNVIKLPDKAVVKYIVMEYMEGRVLEPVEDPSQICKIADILARLAKIRSSTPGALSGGVSCGILWSESEPPFFHAIEDLEFWFNRRLSKHDPKLVLGGYELGLCHLDIARNFLLLQDGFLCLIDWASAGFYPRLFEVCLLRITHGMKGFFVSDVLQLGDLTDKEEVHIKSMLQAYNNTARYYL
ncbi:hypothetical protein BJ875DRAFT_455860 [Amylocarpus encephaloides]|uniref:Aminoglycoside phosphotransferase domain-containing protein n=1 Tax=Amylocarpus encephaloides TaxID=45428 RepID=A0A9P8C7D1_9HELO|nr:hypothetical protein BJ875DRAFT_455860 [Amylocarpus encephaloides]